MDVRTFSAHRRSLATPGGEIAYTEFGDGPAVMFVHGIGTSGLLWRHVVEMLSDTSRCIAVDLPVHGGTPAREDLSVAALAEVVMDLCDGLGLEQVDLVANDTGGAIVQIAAARHQERLRSLALTNCDTDGNFPPPEFVPMIEAAKRGQLADTLVATAANPGALRDSPLAVGYEHPERIPDEVWHAYLTPITGTMAERARHFERMLAAIDPADLSAVSGALRALRVPTLIVWGTGDTTFGVTWAQALREMSPGAEELIEVDGAKLFFPEERPGDLVPHLRRHWGR